MASLPPKPSITLPPKATIHEPDVQLAPWKVPEYTIQGRTEVLWLKQVPIHFFARLKALQILAPRVKNQEGKLKPRTWSSMVLEALEYGILTMEKKYGKY